jgi:hypothetical protein
MASALFAPLRTAAGLAASSVAPGGAVWVHRPAAATIHARAALECRTGTSGRSFIEIADGSYRPAADIVMGDEPVEIYLNRLSLAFEESCASVAE